MKHQALICSYPKDWEWLGHCLASLNKFAFYELPPVVCVDTQDAPAARSILDRVYPEATLWLYDGRPGQGFMRAQIAMMRADQGCPQADIIHFLGSDCIATHPFNPAMYADEEGKPYVLYTHHVVLPGLAWKGGTERVLGIANVEYEFMRRLPTVLPAKIFAPMRAHVEKHHGMEFDAYIHAGNEARRDTSEANILGAYAYYFMPDMCHWLNTQGEYDPAKHLNAIGQHWSHGGLDRPSDAAYLFTGTGGVQKCAYGRTPRSLIDEIVYSRAPNS